MPFSRKTRKPTPARIAVLSLALLSAAALSPIAPATSAWAADPQAAPVSTSNPNPINATPAGQMMSMQTAAMQNSAQSNANSSFDGNVPKSTSLSANFGWMDTFDASALNGGYGGGVTVTRWITAHSGLNMNIEILSFGLGNANNFLSTNAPSISHQAGTPIIPITLGYVYDVTGGQSWVNPQFFADGGLAVTLNGETAPLVADAGFGVTTPLAKFSDALAGIDLFANIRWAYISNIGGLADTAVGLDGHPTLVGASNAALNYMPIEFGATFVF